jgi:hypothetical protein
MWTLYFQLCFKKGDIITITQREEGGWWEGTLGDKTGWFPSNYVKEYKTQGIDSCITWCTFLFLIFIYMSDLTNAIIYTIEWFCNFLFSTSLLLYGVYEISLFYSITTVGSIDIPYIHLICYSSFSHHQVFYFFAFTNVQLLLVLFLQWSVLTFWITGFPVICNAIIYRKVCLPLKLNLIFLKCKLVKFKMKCIWNIFLYFVWM